ncbi:MAG: hypothetical protein JNJ71_03595 [Rubrivivax sp.]|nr:hypothetical protein [Rubrivivax sp.]
MTSSRSTPEPWLATSRAQQEPHPRAAPPKATRSRHLPETRVVKTLRPGKPGTLKLQRRYGADLICVRHRHDPIALYRYVTVELVVSKSLVNPRAFARHWHPIRLHVSERNLREQVKSAGGRWDPDSTLWWLRGAHILKLGLVDRISTKHPRRKANPSP